MIWFNQFFNGNLFNILRTDYFQESGMRNWALYWSCWLIELVINTFFATLKVSPDVLQMQIFSVRLFHTIDNFGILFGGVGINQGILKKKLN